MNRSICENCKHHCYISAIIKGSVYADPPEEYCDEESENFLTEDGCYNYENSLNLE